MLQVNSAPRSLECLTRVIRSSVMGIKEKLPVDPNLLNTARKAVEELVQGVLSYIFLRDACDEVRLFD